MNKTTTPRSFVSGIFVAAAVMVAVSSGDAVARSSSQAPSKVTLIYIPYQGFNAENLIEHLKPPGLTKIYKINEKEGFLHVMAQDQFGNMKRAWV
jgi:hypothetical protein